jgi:hypothetical protein
VSDKITSRAPFTEDQAMALRKLVAMIIPASEAFDLPGADDETIFADILETSAAHSDDFKIILSDLDGLAAEHHGLTFANLSDAQRDNLIQPVLLEKPGGLALLESVTAQCYYRDGRVMQSLDMEIRPPFPEGYELEQGDWSLLDPVRQRPAFYRKP